jgi:hypothetical protein
MNCPGGCLGISIRTAVALHLTRETLMTKANEVTIVDAGATRPTASNTEAARS